MAAYSVRYLEQVFLKYYKIKFKSATLKIYCSLEKHPKNEEHRLHTVCVSTAV